MNVNEKQNLLQKSMHLIIDYDAKVAKLIGIMRWMQNPSQHIEEAEKERKELWDRLLSLIDQRNELLNNKEGNETRRQGDVGRSE